MNALLYKDLISIKLTLALMMLVASLFAIGFGQGGPLSFFIGPAIASTVVGTSLNLDEKSGWLKFAISSGISRRTVAFNKLKLAFLVTSIGILAGFVGIAFNSIDTEILLDAKDVIIMTVFGYSFGMLTSCVMIFACYRFDASYCGLFAAVIIGACVGFMTGASEYLVDALNDAAWLFPIFTVIFACLGAVFFVAGMRVVSRMDL